MKESYFENDFITIYIEYGIVFCIYKENVVVSLEFAKAMVDQRLIITQDKVYPIFADIRVLKYTTKEARQYLKGKGAEGLSAGAFLINSAVQQILGNYFIKFDRPPIPIRLFTDQGKALQWVQKFKGGSNPIINKSSFGLKVVL